MASSRAERAYQFLPFIITALLTLAAVSAPHPATAQTWTQENPVNSPSPRCCFAMTYDDAHANVVLFGGFDLGGNALGDTWTWDGRDWTQHFPANSPTARGYVTMAYDVKHSRAVMFGGTGAANGVTTPPRGDTWLWDGQNWALAVPAFSPQPRSLASLAYDSIRAQVVLFAGVSPAAAYTDTWLWDGSTWTQSVNSDFIAIPGDLTFADNLQAVARYDGPFVNKPLSTWTGSGWASQPVVGTMPLEGHGGFAYDPTSGRLIYFGGTPGAGVYVNTTWAWASGTGTVLNPPTSPPARGYTSMVYDKARQNIVLFGGIPNAPNFLSDTWVFGTPTQTPPTGLTAVAGNAQVVLNWVTPAVLPTEYRVYVYQVNGTASQLVGTAHVPSPGSHQVVSATSDGIALANNQMYRFEVTAFGTSGESTSVIAFAEPGAFVAPAHPSRPVLFLHGIDAQADAWNDTMTYLEQTLHWTCGGTLSFKQDNPTLLFSDSSLPSSCPYNASGDLFTSNFGNRYADYANNLGIEQQGNEVKAFLATLSPRGKTSVVAWSMGGLAARSFIESNPQLATGQISDLSTLATPHWGVHLATLRSLAGQLGAIFINESTTLNSRGATDMDGGCVANGDSTNYQELSPFLYSLNVTHSLPSTIHYTHVTGEPLSGLRLDLCQAQPPPAITPLIETDLIVPVPSSTLQGLLPSSQHWNSLIVGWDHHQMPSAVGTILCVLDPSCLVVQVHSPVDITITAPNGQVISNSTTTIPGAEYLGVPEAGGDSTASVVIPFPQAGQYSIVPTPKATALPTDTYSITVTQNGVTSTVANALPVSSISSGSTSFSTSSIALPKANAGPSRTVKSDPTERPTITLNGSGSSDPNGLSLSYLWTDPSGKVLGTSAVIHVKANFGTTYYTLTVTDSAGLAASAQTAITVVPERK